tara:strand:+ start:7464 stop:7937 length:474 start_codon:yes stop_codon:yes gene_type:complete
MKLFNVVKTTSTDWKILGGKLATRIVKDADNGISQDKDGKRFPSYTVNYALLKSQGKAGLKGVSKDRQVSPPNLRLTGKMLDSIKAQNAKSTSVEILYADGEKVIGHSKKRGKKPKRNIIGLNDKNQQFVEDYFSKKIENNILRYVAKDIKINLDIL